MKILLSAFLLLSLIASSQQPQLINLVDRSTVTCVAYWKKKERVRYHVAETSQTFKGDSQKPNKENKVEYDISLMVIDSADSTYTVDLSYSNFQSTNEKMDPDFELQKLFSKLHVKYKTDELGMFLEIINKKELAQMMGTLIDKLRKDLAVKIKKEDEKTQFNALFDNFKQVFTDENNIEGLFADDIYFIHSFYGLELKVNKEIEVGIEYPAICNIKLGGMGKLMLTEINKQKGECKIQMSQAPDKIELQDYFKKLMVAMLGDFSKKAKVNAGQLKFNSSSKLKYVMDLASGWFIKITSVSNSNISIGDEAIRTVVKMQMELI